MSEKAQSSTATDAAACPNPYLSRPTASSSASSSSTTSSQPFKCASKHETRLYIGNLHPTVDEYTLIQVFKQFGKIAKLDYLFHKSGPHKGQPRGYAFVEYASAQEALQAVVGAHDRTIRGRTISVTFATDHSEADRDSAGGVGPHRRDRTRASNDAESVKTTQLSLLKNANKPQSTDAKIAAMEAKLAKLRRVEKPEASSSTPSAPSTAVKPLHASLPAKPSIKGGKPLNRTARPSHRR